MAPVKESQPILVIGDAMLDRCWDGSVDRISPKAPVPVPKRAPPARERSNEPCVS